MLYYKGLLNRNNLLNKQVTSKDENIVKSLAENRKKFSVDGKASKRLADLIEDISK